MRQGIGLPEFCDEGPRVPPKKTLASRFRLRPTMVSLALFTSASAWADASTAPSSGEVAFNDIFLHQSGHGRVDISRFSKGNAAVAGTYRVDLHVNEVWLGRTEVVLRQVGASQEVHPCFDRALLERIGVDLAALTPEANALLADADACPTLARLVPDAVAHFDNSEQRLDLSLPQVAMSRQPRGYIDPKYWDDGVTAGRLLYNASVYHNAGQGFSSTQGFVRAEWRRERRCVAFSAQRQPDAPRAHRYPLPGDPDVCSALDCLYQEPAGLW